MSLRVFPVVEGHGEEQAIRILLTRIWSELLGEPYLEVLKPLRCPRTRLVRGTDGSTLDQATLQRMLDFAALKLGGGSSIVPGMILFLFDADDAPACRLGPSLLATAQALRSDLDIACVLAAPEYETWFVASAESLHRFLRLGDDAPPPDPERNRLRKGWIEQRFRGIKYSETVDQPALTQAMDLRLCRRRSPSFDKLCRELEKRIPRS